MTGRVNLMQAVEFRRQGLVSTTFIIRVSVLTAVLFALLFGALTLLKYRNARQQLFSAREIWKVREPMYRQTLAMKQDLATKKKMDQELAGWKVSRIEWNKPLAVLWQIVHPSIQFRRLNIRGETEISLRKGAPPKTGTPKAGAKAAAAGDKGAGKSARAPAAPGVPVRHFFLLIEGRASGHMAEDIVLQFDAALRRSPIFRAILESVRLQRLQSEEDRTKGPAGRAFAIEASTRKREMP
ncbi:MAG: hypothetical protein KKC51_06420 [Verrucomicrobia bacterium]|nr:hypothetical protein [Verrucomicrobiota bacterium]